MNLTNKQKKRFRAIGHQLRPVVTVASKGLTQSVLDEIDRALDDHELVKIKFNIGDRVVRDALLKELIDAVDAATIQTVGSVALIVRLADSPNPVLSNLLRPGML